VSCFRQKPFQAILNATKVADPLAAVLGNFGPTIDEKTVFSDYDDRAENGDFVQRPYLVGNNNYEAGLFKILGIQRNITAQEWCLFDAAVFTCPAAKAAAYRAKQKINTFRYRYYGDFDNLRLTDKPPLGPSGAWHGAEIPIVFRTAVDASQEANTPDENEISKYLHGVWAAFAKDPEHALYEHKYNFPQYDAKSKFLSFLSPSLLHCAIGSHPKGRRITNFSSVPNREHPHRVCKKWYKGQLCVSIFDRLSLFHVGRDWEAISRWYRWPFDGWGKFATWTYPG
jgi:hypothetical protein